MLGDIITLLITTHEPPSGSALPTCLFVRCCVDVYIYIYIYIYISIIITIAIVIMIMIISINYINK